MDTRIEPYEAHHLDAVVRLSLHAWAPVFESLQNVLDPDVYQPFYPDWRVNQQTAGLCRRETPPGGRDG